MNLEIMHIGMHHTYVDVSQYTQSQYVCIIMQIYLDIMHLERYDTPAYQYYHF